MTEVKTEIRVISGPAMAYQCGHDVLAASTFCPECGMQIKEMPISEYVAVLIGKLTGKSARTKNGKIYAQVLPDMVHLSMLVPDTVLATVEKPGPGLPVVTYYGNGDMHVPDVDITSVYGTWRPTTHTFDEIKEEDKEKEYDEVYYDEEYDDKW